MAELDDDRLLRVRSDREDECDSNRTDRPPVCVHEILVLKSTDNKASAWRNARRGQTLFNEEKISAGNAAGQYEP
ncbi:MAG: hypothetical protein ABWZ93_15590 [Xanthobacteraceae bacterium]